MKIDMGTTVDCADKVAAILASIDETKKIVNSVVINKNNFLLLALHLADLKPLLELLTQPLFESLDTRRALIKLASLADRAYVVTKQSIVRSRIYLVHQSSAVFLQIKRLDKDMMDSLDLFPSSLSAPLQEHVKNLRIKLESGAFCLDPDLEQLAKAIKVGLDRCQIDEPYATTLLQSIAEFLQDPLSAAELKVELEDDLAAAERENVVSDVQVLTQLCQLLRPASVLADVRRLASQRFLPFSPDCRGPIPSSFICPITKLVMVDPVMISEAGYTYESSAIREWFSRGNRTCPDTGKELESLDLVPNRNLRQAMEEFFDLRGRETLIVALEKIRSDSPAEHEEAVHIIKSLIDADSKYKRLVVSMDGLKPLVTVLRRAAPVLKENILRLLCGIAAVGEEQKVLLKEAGAVPVLLRIIIKNPGEHGGAVQLLWELSRCEAGKAAILAEPLSVVTIASALNHCTGDQKRLLNDLCKGNTKVVIQVASAGVFGPLVAMLRPGNDMAVRTEMAAAICDFGLNEHSTAALGQAGAVPPLLLLLQQGYLDGKIAAAEALLHLSSCDSNRTAIASADGVATLVSYLDSSSEELTGVVVGTLANLAAHRGCVDQMDRQSATAKLVDIVTLGEKTVKENAIKTLQCMAKDSRSVRLALKGNSEVLKIFALLQDEGLSSSGRSSIIRLICHLAGDRHSRSSVILSRELLRLFIRLLEQPISSEEKEAIVGILSSLSKEETMRDVLLQEQSMLPGIVKCLDKSCSPKVKDSAAACLAKLMDLTSLQIQVALARQGMVALLLDLISSGTEGSKRDAAHVLGILSKHTPELTKRQTFVKRSLAALGMKKYRACKVHAGKCSKESTMCLIESGAVPYLIKLVREGGLSSSEAAMEALYTLLTNEQDTERAIDFLVKNEIISSISSLVGKSKTSTEQAVTVLEKIFRLRRYRDQRYFAPAKSGLLVTMTSGSTDARRTAAMALTHLELMPNNSTCTQ